MTVLARHWTTQRSWGKGYQGLSTTAGKEFKPVNLQKGANTWGHKIQMEADGKKSSRVQSLKVTIDRWDKYDQEPKENKLPTSQKKYLIFGTCMVYAYVFEDHDTFLQGHNQ